jgi:DNA-binding transcriptional MerR regulator
MAREAFDDDDLPLFTVGQVAEMLAVKQAFLRRVDELRVVSPQRSAGGQRRYTRVEIRVIQQVASMADEGMTMTAIRRIIELQRQLAEVIRERDEYAALLGKILSERPELTRILQPHLRRDGDDAASATGPREQRGHR